MNRYHQMDPVKLDALADVSRVKLIDQKLRALADELDMMAEEWGMETSFIAAVECMGVNELEQEIEKHG